MRFDGRITERDFVRSNFVHFRPRPTFAVLGIALVVLALAVLSWTAHRALTTGDHAVLAAALAGSLGYLAVCFFVYVPWRSRKTYRQYRAASMPFSVEIGETGLRFQCELGSGVLPWDHIHRWREGKSMFLLYPADVLYHIVPKSEIPLAFVEELRTVLVRHVGPAT